MIVIIDLCHNVDSKYDSDITAGGAERLLPLLLCLSLLFAYLATFSQKRMRMAAIWARMAVAVGVKPFSSPTMRPVPTL